MTGHGIERRNSTSKALEKEDSSIITAFERFPNELLEHICEVCDVPTARKHRFVNKAFSVMASKRMIREKWHILVIDDPEEAVLTGVQNLARDRSAPLITDLESMREDVTKMKFFLASKKWGVEDHKRSEHHELLNSLTPNLRVLSVRDRAGKGMLLLSEIKSGQNLEALELRSDSEIKQAYTSLMQGLCGYQMPNLKHLKLERIKSEDHTGFRRMLRTFGRALRSLHIDFLTITESKLHFPLLIWEVGQEMTLQEFFGIDFPQTGVPESFTAKGRPFAGRMDELLRRALGGGDIQVFDGRKGSRKRSYGIDHSGVLWKKRRGPLQIDAPTSEAWAEHAPMGQRVLWRMWRVAAFFFGTDPLSIDDLQSIA